MKTRIRQDDTPMSKAGNAARRNGDIWISQVNHQYLVEIWDEGVWVPVGYDRHPMFDFDAARHVRDYQQIEYGRDSESSLCGIYRNEQVNTLPLYQQGYECAYAYERPYTVRYLERTFPSHHGHITHPFSEGKRAARADYDLYKGEMWVSTDTNPHPRTPVNLYLL